MNRVSCFRSITEAVVGGPPFRIGDDVLSVDRRRVRIVDGVYWGERGFSNFWTWREVRVATAGSRSRSSSER